MLITKGVLLVNSWVRWVIQRCGIRPSGSGVIHPVHCPVYAPLDRRSRALRAKYHPKAGSISIESVFF